MTHDAQRMKNDEAESTCHDFLNLALARLEASAIFLLPAKAISGCEYRYSPGSSSEQNSRVNDYGDSGSTSYYCTRYNLVYHAVTHDRVVSSGYTSFSACSLEAGHGDSIIADLDLERTLIDPKMKASGFSDTSVDRVRAKSQVFGLNNVTLVKGYFEESLPRFPETTFAFVHLDCDTYSAYRECLAYFYPRLSPAGIIVFDEYDDEAWPGCKIAVDEFFTDGPDRLQIICRDNYVKTYFCEE